MNIDIFMYKFIVINTTALKSWLQKPPELALTKTDGWPGLVHTHLDSGIVHSSSKEYDTRSKRNRICMVLLVICMVLRSLVSHDEPRLCCVRDKWLDGFIYNSCSLNHNCITIFKIN